MHSNYPQSPPPPHQTQAHFYGAPEIDFGPQQPRSEASVSDNKFCCVFDSLTAAGEEGLTVGENVLLVGAEHRLDVYRVDKKTFDRVGRLGGLRGSVIGAKILPSTLRVDTHRSLRPLIAIIIHGPQNAPELETPSRPGTSHSEDAMFDPSSSMLQILQNTDPKHQTSNLQYQTTVEVYSLRQGRHITTLLKCPKVEIDSLRESQGHGEPSPSGNLSIQAKGKFVVVSSGVSGEVYIFESQSGTPDDSSTLFKCIGKVWTRVSPRRLRSLSISSNASDAENKHGMNPIKLNRPDTATVSLSHRWLAIVPPPPSAQSTLHGIVDAVRSLKPPGLSSHTSPAEPQTTCDLETPEGESVLSKVARDVTQEFIKGARWVGDRGVQAWNSYWARPSDQQSTLAYPSANNARWEPNSHQAFPPTHANDDGSNRSGNQPAAVSILDLEKLSVSQNIKTALALQPVATFSLPYGCSLVSFSPSGLSLLTASAKGDVQHVWDLLRMIHGEAGISLAKVQAVSDRRPIVREIARFTRMTVAKIADVVWAEPRGERFAVVTERGTVHIFDLPPSAFRWPPPRQAVKSTSMPANPDISEQDPDSLVSPASTGNTFSAAIDLVTGKTQPLFAAVRGRPSTIGSAFAGLGGLAFPPGASAKGGKAVAAGFSKSVGAATGTVSTLRHLGENRLALPGSSQPAIAGCVRWLTGKDQGLIAVTGGGILRIHSIRRSNHRKAAKRRPSVLGGKPVEYSISNASNKLSQDILGNGEVDEASTSPRSYWLPYTPEARVPRDTTHPLSFAEIETNAPYQPFHTDRRINFYVYKQADISPIAYEVEPWAFGESIPAIKISVGSGRVVDNDEALSLQSRQTQMENFVSVEGTEEQGQQVIVTTRRKRGSKKGATSGSSRDDEDFFEDECEVVDFADERV